MGKIISKVFNMGNKNTGVSSDFWENCMILKKNTVGRRLQ
jgi:hypothetical protein